MSQIKHDQANNLSLFSLYVFICGCPFLPLITVIYAAYILSKDTDITAY